jgi:hypothetical protein
VCRCRSSIASRRSRPEPIRTAVQKVRPDQRRPAPFQLRAGSPIDEAPSIGSGVAAKLAACGIRTIGDWLRADLVRCARQLSREGIDAMTIRHWQAQAELVCALPELTELEAQLLTGSGITKPSQLQGMTVQEVLTPIGRFTRTPQGRMVLGTNPTPGPREVSRWIEALRLGQGRQAA